MEANENGSSKTGPYPMINAPRRRVRATIEKAAIALRSGPVTHNPENVHTPKPIHRAMCPEGGGVVGNRSNLESIT